MSEKMVVLIPTSKFHYVFQWLLCKISWSLMTLNRHNKWHGYSLHALWTSSNTCYI